MAEKQGNAVTLRGDGDNLADVIRDLETKGELPEQKAAPASDTPSPAVEPPVAPPSPAAAPTPEPSQQAAPAEGGEDDFDPEAWEKDAQGNWRFKGTDHRFLKNHTAAQLNRAYISAQNKINRLLAENEQLKRAPVAAPPSAPAPQAEPAASALDQRYEAAQEFRWTDPARYDREIMDIAVERAVERSTAAVSAQRQQEERLSHTERVSAAGHAAISAIVDNYGISEDEANDRAAYVLLKINNIIAANPQADRRILENPETFMRGYQEIFGGPSAKPIVVAASAAAAPAAPPGPKKAAPPAQVKRSGSTLSDADTIHARLLAEAAGADPDKFINRLSR